METRQNSAYLHKACIIGLLALFAFSSRCFALKPDSVYIANPSELHTPYDSAMIKTPDGALLKSWTILPIGKNLHTTLVFANGDAGNMSYFIYEAYRMAQNGFTAILFDYRGFGHSSYFKIDTNYLFYRQFATDLSSAIAYARKGFPENRIGVLALSMGTLLVSTIAEKEKLDFIIGDSYVSTSINNILRRIKKKGRKMFVPKGFGNYGKVLKRIGTPILVFGGTLDQMTTLEDERKFVRERSDRKLIVYKGVHGRGFYTLSEGYERGQIFIDDIIQFLNEEKAISKVKKIYLI